MTAGQSRALSFLPHHFRGPQCVHRVHEQRSRNDAGALRPPWHVPGLHPFVTGAARPAKLPALPHADRQLHHASLPPVMAALATFQSGVQITHVQAAGIDRAAGLGHDTSGLPWGGRVKVVSPPLLQAFGSGACFAQMLCYLRSAKRSPSHRAHMRPLPRTLFPVQEAGSSGRSAPLKGSAPLPSTYPLLLPAHFLCCLPTFFAD